MRKITLLILIIAAQVNAIAQAPESDKSAIKQMCGCYEVSFQYAETFSSSDQYQKHEDYSAKALEWIFVDEESQDMLRLQHLLIISDEKVIKHWRQDWIYENTNFLTYQRNLEWKHAVVNAKEVKGTWTQKVFEVDDSPRYQGYATWLKVDGKTYWESQVAAPLPRREYTKRDDYNLMLRNNKHILTETGHVHELDNAKIIRSEEGDSTLVWEKGMNIYTRVNDERCAQAQMWWQNQRSFWVDVRNVWHDKLNGKEYVNLRWEIEDYRLWHRIFALQNELEKEGYYSPGSGLEQIEEIIDIYLSEEPSPWASSNENLEFKN